MYSKLAFVAVAVLVAVAGVFAEEYNCNAEGRVCQNGGVCHENALAAPGSGVNNNGWTTPYCQCTAPYGGPDCSYTIRECKDSPCQNGGTCTPAACALAATQLPFNTYDCFTCACPKGWGGSPAALSTNNLGGYCDWKQVVQDCTNNQCANGGTCTNLPFNGGASAAVQWGYSCACTAGWRGGQTGQTANRAWNCTVPDCTQNDGSCLNGGSCTGPASNKVCSCINNYWGDRCENAPFCSSNPCTNGQTCQDNGDGTGSCQSPPFCSSNPCGNGGTCSSITQRCTCPSPFDGYASCNGTLFCQSNPCQNGATCTNDPGSTAQGGAGYCTCPAGYAGQFCEVQIKGCGYSNNGFPVGCAPIAGGAAGCNCVDQSSCDSSNFNTRCGCPATTGGLVYYDCRCNSTTVSKCPGKSNTNYNGQNSDMVCQNGGTCTEAMDATGCLCRPGFWGDKCQNYDNPCLNSPCENGGQCRIVTETQGLPLDDRYWAYRCNCRWPYYGKHCEKVAPFADPVTGVRPTVCAPDTCLNGGTCSAQRFGSATGRLGGFFYANPWTTYLEEGGPFQCSCPPNFGGQRCEVEVERCTATTCANGGFCRNLPNVGVQCQCPCGYAGDKCEIVASNAAANSLAQLSADGAGGVGYALEFCSRVTCQNGGTCYHSLNGQNFYCSCKSGYTGTYCQYQVRSAAAGVVPSLIAVAAAVAAAFALKH